MRSTPRICDWIRDIYLGPLLVRGGELRGGALHLRVGHRGGHGRAGLELAQPPLQRLVARLGPLQLSGHRVQLSRRLRQQDGVQGGPPRLQLRRVRGVRARSRRPLRPRVPRPVRGAANLLRVARRIHHGSRGVLCPLGLARRWPRPEPLRLEARVRESTVRSPLRRRMNDTRTRAEHARGMTRPLRSAPAPLRVLRLRQARGGHGAGLRRGDGTRSGVLARGGLQGSLLGRAQGEAERLGGGRARDLLHRRSFRQLRSRGPQRPPLRLALSEQLPRRGELLRELHALRLKSENPQAS
eukprot:1189942-Prorocentrum_minimum.AAC.2